MRWGIAARKLGMTRVLTSEGRCCPVTLLEVDENVVVAHKTVEKHGYCAVVLGTESVPEKKLSKPLQGIFKSLGTSPYRNLHESRLAPGEELPSLGTVVGVSVFSPGQSIDVTGVTIGKGFAGGMKRHNFGGLRASHGVSICHRSHGSTGNRQDPGRVFKGKKMAGHMGDVRATLQNLEVFGTDPERKLLIVHGSIPGSKGGRVIVRCAVKRQVKA